MVVAYGQQLATVFAVSIPDVNGSPPTSAAALPPFAFSPWHTEHLAAKIVEPCSGVPLPGGNPVPSGRMLMSHAATSASDIGFPSPCANAADTPSTTSTDARPHCTDQR